MNANDCYQALYQNDLFSGLSVDEFQKIFKFFKKIQLSPGDYLFREGDPAAEFFVIMQGEITILKYGEIAKETLAITTLSSGDVIGEMTLLDSGQRSASARAVTTVSLMGISFNDLKTLAEHDLNLSKLLLKISKNLSVRLRKTNDTTIRALEQQLNEQKLRASLGAFMVNVIVGLCLFSFALTWFQTLNKIVSGGGVLSPGTIVASLIFVLFILTIVKFSNLPLSAFGLTLKGWRQAVVESFAFTALICAAVLLLKWGMIKVLPQFANVRLFNLYHDVAVSYELHLSQTSIWFYSMLIYGFVISPLQELLARGGLQGPMEIFFVGKYRKFKAILISNIMFSTSHLFISIKFAVIVFFAGLYFGWLFSRHRNLLGVIIAHSILGAWSFWILGINFFL